MLLTPISWADRVWALPFLTVLAPSERYNQQRAKQHKKITDWARQMIFQLSRWLPNRLIIIVADSSYSVIELLDSVRRHVCMITRLRLDAALHDFVPPRPAGQVGRKRKKGKRLPSLLQRLDDPNTPWTELIIPKWYNHGSKTMQVATGTAIWYHSGMPPLPIRWVLIKDPYGRIDPAGLLSTKLDLDAAQIINCFIRRWTVEVTFEEVRAHLGVETQRQWSDLAIARSTPVLMAMFSLITLWADQLQKHNLLLLKPCAWYQKSRPTFSDAIASVRYRIWRNQYFSMSLFKADIQKLNPPWVEHLILMLTRAA